MGQTNQGDRHEINLETAISNGIVKSRATCICGGLDAPARFGRERAEEDGHDHMQRKRGNRP